MRTVARVLLALVATAAIATAQGGDSWFILDRFSGLNLYIDETNLSPEQALKAENVQFSKTGTISALEGLTHRATLLSSADEILGLGSIEDFINDSDRIITACSSYFWNSYGNSLASYDKSTAQHNNGAWETFTDSLRFEDTLDVGRACEFWRPGWWIQRSAKFAGTPQHEYLPINYIDDNNTVWVDSVPDSAYVHDADDAVHPILASQSTAVRFVNIDIKGRQQVVCLQAGMEPVLYDGSSLSSMRYFGIADSGVVQYCKGIQYSNLMIVDDTKLGLYDINELFLGGYWIQLAGGSPEGDSSYFGHIFRIDSNTIQVTTSSDTSAVDSGSTHFMIWISYAEASGDGPAAFDLDTLTRYVTGANYNIISAPMLREVLSEEESPLVKVVDGGRWFKTLESDSVVGPRTTDHIPHVVELTSKADTMISSWVEAIVHPCYTTDPGYPGICTTYNTFSTIVPLAGMARMFPIRTILGQDATDSVRIWTAGTIHDTSYADFQTSDWRIWKVSIPYASDGIVYNGRLYLAGDPEDPNLVAYSEIHKMGAFPTYNVFWLSAVGDEFVGFAKIYDWLVIFQKYHTYILKGDPALGYLPELALPDVGCVARESILEVENKVMFLSDKGWQIYDGNTAQDFAQSIKPAVQARPRINYKVNPSYRHKASAVADAASSNIWLSMPFGVSTRNSGSFVWNYADGSFSYSDEVYGAQGRSVYFNDTLWTIFTRPDSARIYTYGYTDSLDATGMDGDYMTQKWSTGWLDMGSPFERKYLSEGVLKARLSAPVAEGNGRPFYISMYRDFDTTSFFKDTINVWGLVASKHFDFETSWKLEPQTSVAWLRIEVEGTGMLVMDIQRIALRYHLDDDIVRRDVQGVRP